MSIKTLLSGKRNVISNPINDLTEKVSQIAASRAFSDPSIAEFAISTESLSDSNEQVLINVYNNIETTLKTITSDFGIAIEDFQLEAASMAGIFGSNPALSLASKLKTVSPDHVLIRSDAADGFMERPIALEAYDERDNRNSQTYSIIYNLMASRQDDFGEAFFPTLVVNSNEVGITISVKIFYVYNDFKRSVTGALANYARKNVIRAYTDPEILKNELTAVVPVYRDGGGADDNTIQFVPVVDVASWSQNLGVNTIVPTAALRIGKTIDLLGISQTNELLNSGIMGPTDTLDTNLKLEAIYVKFTDGALLTDIVRIDVSDLPAAPFIFSPQANYRRMNLAIDTDGLVMDNTTVNADGSPLTYITEFATNKARIRLNINGSVILDKGDCILNPGKLELVAMRNNANLLINGPASVALAAKFETAEVIGYTLSAFRANSNIRQRGQLLDSQIEYQIYQLPYRSPLSVITPAISNGTEDNSALQTLITVTGIRVSNEAVAALVRSRTALKSYNPVGDQDNNLPEISPIGRFYVQPVYFEDSIDMVVDMDSLRAHERLKDIRAALVERIRYYAIEMYRISEYKAAALVLTGNAGFKPTVVIGTDLLIYNYLQSDGDLRTLGESFDVKIVATLDNRVAGKIFLTFGVFDSARNTSVNPLNFGNMLWSPELTVVLPVSRDGQTSKELLVAPRFNHIVNLPIMTVLNVSNIPEVAGHKATINVNGPIVP